MRPRANLELSRNEGFILAGLIYMTNGAHDNA
jgi:hypothetical protein